MRRSRRVMLLALCLSSGTAGAVPAPLSLLCERSGGTRSDMATASLDAATRFCEQVVSEVTERFARRNRAVQADGSELPRVTVSWISERSVRVRVEVEERSPSTRQLDLLGESSPAWTVAITVEQMLEREEAAAAEPAVVATSPPRTPTKPTSRSLVWFGVEGGARGDALPDGLAIAYQAGGVAGWSPAGRVLFRVRAYGEIMRRDPWATEAFGIATGPGIWILERGSFRLGLVLEAFLRLVAARYTQEDGTQEGPKTNVEGGAGLWLDVSGPDGPVRFTGNVGLEAFVPRLNPRSHLTEDTLDPPLVAPSLRLGVIFLP